MMPDLKQIKETNALLCIECARCSGICPVARYSQTFSPRLLLTKTLRNTKPDSIQSADLWACLNCQCCEEICPSNIKYTDLIQILRQAVGIQNMEGTCSHGGILQSISQIMASANLKQNRLDWLGKEYNTSKNSDYLFFMGCLPYFDALFTDINVQSLNIARSNLRILNYFNIQPQLLSNEKCCGHDFFWKGDIETFKKLAEANLEMIEQSGAKKIITSCPECYRTLKVEYSRFFGKLPYEIEHISEFLSAKLAVEKIELKSRDMKITFQDPCRLGRHLGIYEAPRACFTHLPNVEFREMAHHHKRAICCGVSGWMNCSQISKQIQMQRLKEAQDSGADTLVTACAKCQIHFQCALRDTQLAEQITLKVKDFSELFAENLH